MSVEGPAQEDCPLSLEAPRSCHVPCTAALRAPEGTAGWSWRCWEELCNSRAAFLAGARTPCEVKEGVRVPLLSPHLHLPGMSSLTQMQIFFPAYIASGAPAPAWERRGTGCLTSAGTAAGLAQSSEPQRPKTQARPLPFSTPCEVFALALLSAKYTRTWAPLVYRLV